MPPPPEIVEPKVGMELKFFTWRMFGVLVGGRVWGYDEKTKMVSLDAEHRGIRWKEKVRASDTFYSAVPGAPAEGAEFTFLRPEQECATAKSSNTD